MADRPKRSSRRFRLLVLAGFVTLTLSLGGWVERKAIFAGIGYSLICSQTPRQADLILVLGGEFYGPRVFTAADLAMKGYAPLVLISGPPYKDGRPEGEFAIEYLVGHGYPRKLFAVFGHKAHSTVDEAIALAPELRRRRVKRVILVNNAYHSRRADIVVRLFCGNGIQFISVPAPDSYYSPDRWWDDPGSRKMFFSEWRKIVGSVFLAFPEYLFHPWPRQ